MSEPKVHEVVPLVLGNEIPAPADTRDQLKAVARETQKEALNAQWRRGLELARNIKEVNYEAFARKIASFGTDLEDDPKKTNYGEVRKTEKEKNWSNQLEATRDRLKLIFEHGIDAEGVKKEELIKDVLEQVARIPSFTARFNEIVAQGKQEELALKLLTDPKYIGELKNIVNDLLDKDFSNDVFDKFEDFMLAKQEMEIADAEMEEWMEKNIINDRELKAFEKLETGDPVPTAAKAVELHDLRAGRDERALALDDLQLEVDKAERELKDLEDAKTITTTRVGQTPEMITSQQAFLMEKGGRAQAEVDRLDREIRAIADASEGKPEDQRRVNMLQSQRRDFAAEARQAKLDYDQLSNTPVQRELTQLQKDIDGARERLQKAQRDLRLKKAEDERLKQLEQEEREFTANKERLAAQQREIQGRQDLARNKYGLKQREYKEAAQIRLADEESFTQRVESSFGQAGANVAIGMIEDIVEGYGRGFEKAKAGWQSTQEEAFMNTINKTWLSREAIRRMEGLPGKRKSERTNPINKAQVLHDYSTLLREGDTAFVRSIMERTLNPDADPPNSRTYNKQEIDDVFEKNPDLVARIKPEATKQLLARKVLMGGITPEDSLILSSTPWGKIAVEAGYNQVTDFRNLVDKHFGEGALKRHGFWQRFGQELAKHPFWWSILLGIPALFKTIGTEPNRDTLDNQR